MFENKGWFDKSNLIWKFNWKLISDQIYCMLTLFTEFLTLSNFNLMLSKVFITIEKIIHFNLKWEKSLKTNFHRRIIEKWFLTTTLNTKYNFFEVIRYHVINCWTIGANISGRIPWDAKVNCFLFSKYSSDTNRHLVTCACTRANKKVYPCVSRNIFLSLR